MLADSGFIIVPSYQAIAYMPNQSSSTFLARESRLQCLAEARSPGRFSATSKIESLNFSLPSEACLCKLLKMAFSGRFSQYLYQSLRLVS